MYEIIRRHGFTVQSLYISEYSFDLLWLPNVNIEKWFTCMPVDLEIMYTGIVAKSLVVIFECFIYLWWL